METLTRRHVGWAIVVAFTVVMVLASRDEPLLAAGGVAGLAVGVACFFGARQSRRWCSDAVAEETGAGVTAATGREARRPGAVL